MIRFSLAALLLLTGCGGAHVATVPPSNPFPLQAWVLDVGWVEFTTRYVTQP